MTHGQLALRPQARQERARTGLKRCGQDCKECEEPEGVGVTATERLALTSVGGDASRTRRAQVDRVLGWAGLGLRGVVETVESTTVGSGIWRRTSGH